jgi:dTDP-4-dehydrorhamnose 3,5-epimerase
MKKIATNLEGVFVLEPKVFGDERGFFIESFNKKTWLNLGLPDLDFIQDNHSKSSKGVLRGLHFQHPQPQGKLVRVTRGAVFDVVVDIRKGSPSFGQWFGIKLSADNKKQLWIPAGFAHGFLTLEDDTEFLYKCTDFYAPEYEKTLIWDDSKISIDWPLLDVDYQLSEKDLLGKSFKELGL